MKKFSLQHEQIFYMSKRNNNIQYLKATLRTTGKRNQLIGHLKPTIRIKPFLALRNDPRIIDYITKLIPYHIETRNEAFCARFSLQKTLSCDVTTRIITALGYKYQSPRHILCH